jgi:hypothetical protein
MEKKKHFFFDFVDVVDVVVQGLYLGLYDIQITTNKFCIARVCSFSCMCGVFVLKKNLHKQKSEKLLKKLVETPFCIIKLL